MRRVARSFTLIEILVVIGIIGILTAISIPAISAVRRKSQVSTTTAFLQRVALAIESYQSDFGDYPPSRFKRLGMGKTNGQNEGSESLLRCLTTSAKGGPYMEFEDQELANTDSDSLFVSTANPTRSLIKSAELFEVVDPWGNPVAYIHNADYGAGATVSISSDGADRKPVLVKAAGSEKTGQYKGLTTFQLWSAGPDGEADTDDDIRVWGD